MLHIYAGPDALDTLLLGTDRAGTVVTYKNITLLAGEVFNKAQLKANMWVPKVG